MLDKGTQSIIDSAIAERVAFLAEIVRTGNEVSAIAAAMRLGAIGTQYSNRIAIELFGQIPEVFVRGMFSGTPTCWFANEKIIREKLNALRKTATDFNAEAFTTGGIDPRILTLPPLWQTITRALEYEFATNKGTRYCGERPINWPA